MDWNQALPKAKAGSEYLENMNAFLGVVDGLRAGTGAADVAEDYSKDQSVIKLIQKISQVGDMKKKTEDAADRLNKTEDTNAVDPMFKKTGNVIYRRESGLKTKITDTLGGGQISNEKATDTFPKIKSH